MSYFEQTDYKKIIKQLISQLPEKRGATRRLSEYLSVNPSLVSQIISGDKDFTEEQIVLVCEFLGLGSLESRYLLTLVQLSRAGSVKLKRYHSESLENIRQQSLDLEQSLKKSMELTDGQKAKFYSSWLYAAVHLACTINTSTNAGQIANRFKINLKKANSILQFLTECGMVEKVNGTYRAGQVNSHLSKNSDYICAYHKIWRQKSMDAAENLTPEEYMYSCSFSINKKDFLKIREELVRTTKKFLEIAQNSPAEDIAHLNIDLLRFDSDI